MIKLFIDSFYRMVGRVVKAPVLRTGNESYRGFESHTMQNMEHLR